MVREFDGDPAATDSTRILRLPGVANKKYPDSYVQARTESMQTHQLRVFKLQFDSQDAPRHQHEEVVRKPLTQTNTLSQSEHDWAYAKRALVRGDDPEEVIRRIADYRGPDKHDPEYYAWHTVMKAQADLQRQCNPEHPVKTRRSQQNKLRWIIEKCLCKPWDGRATVGGFMNRTIPFAIELKASPESEPTRSAQDNLHSAASTPRLVACLLLLPEMLK